MLHCLFSLGGAVFAGFEKLQVTVPALLNCCMYKQNVQYEVTTVHFSCIWNFRLCLPNTTYLSGVFFKHNKLTLEIDFLHFYCIVTNCCTIIGHFHNNVAHFNTSKHCKYRCLWRNYVYTATAIPQTIHSILYDIIFYILRRCLCTSQYFTCPVVA